jgi:stage V sporulation protein S
MRRTTTPQPDHATPATNAAGTEEEPLRIASESDPNKVAGALAGLVREDKRIIFAVAIGAGADHQFVKAVAVAKGYLASSGLTLMISPAFGETVIDGQERTTMKHTVYAVRAR